MGLGERGKGWYHQYNKVLGKCFCLAGVAATLTALAAGATPAPVARKAPDARVTSVVRADKRTGKLVRSMVVNPNYLGERTAAPQNAGATGTVDAGANAPGRLNAMIAQAAKAHDVDPLLVHSVIQVESNYNQFAISNKGAEGLMQLIPATARRFGVSNSFDAQENIEAGVKYLKHLQELFGDERLALAAYNAGEGAVMKYRDVPPYPETEQYVYNVGRKLGQARSAAKRPPTERQPAAAAPAAPAEPPARGLAAYAGSDGRVYLRTKE